MSVTRPAPVEQAPVEQAPGDQAGEVDPVDPVSAMFASRSVAVHVVRGVLGLVLVVAALALAGDQPLALLLLVPAVLAWRGCPTCWLMGLGATLARRR